MSNPKEKAKELICNFNIFDLDKEKSKQCALIAVGELIKLYEFERPHRGFKISYWDEVKTEIEKL